MVACPHPWPLSQFRERGNECSLLPYVEEELGMRGWCMLALTLGPSPETGKKPGIRNSGAAERRE